MDNEWWSLVGVSSVNACVWGRAPPRAISDSRVIGMLSWQKRKDSLPV